MERNISAFNDTELSVLQAISEFEANSAKLTQRELAERTGISLGMANALVKRLAGRGWVKLNSISAKTMRYALTPAGISELTSRTAGYFRRASRSADLYRDRLEGFVLGAKRRGVATIVLLGQSEVEFLLAYVCDRHGIVFVKSADLAKARSLAKKEGVALVLAEGMDPAAAEGSEPGTGAVPPTDLATILAGAWL
jgi:DNA-binding MarR family transcriptional regulator